MLLIKTLPKFKRELNKNIFLVYTNKNGYCVHKNPMHVFDSELDDKIYAMNLTINIRTTK